MITNRPILVVPVLSNATQPIWLAPGIMKSPHVQASIAIRNGAGIFSVTPNGIIAATVAAGLIITRENKKTTTPKSIGAPLTIPPNTFISSGW